jgi:hypothetical protein
VCEHQFCPKILKICNQSETRQLLKVIKVKVMECSGSEMLRDPGCYAGCDSSNDPDLDWQMTLSQGCSQGQGGFSTLLSYYAIFLSLVFVQMIKIK